MANATSNLKITRVGPEGHTLDVPVDGGSHVFKGTFASALTGTGMFVPGSTAASDEATGVFLFEQDATAVGDGLKRVRIETDRDFLFPCGTAGDAVTEATPIGAVLYMVDDHTVSTVATARKAAGLFQGVDSSGLIRIHVTSKMKVLAAALAS